MLRRIREWPDSILKKQSSPIGMFDESTREIAQDLIDTCNVMMGVGLAAPQIGILKRIIVIDKTKIDVPDIDDKNEINEKFWVLVNPLIECSGDSIKWVEGCLSLPRVDGKVTRFSNVKMSYSTLSGENKHIDLDWPISGAIQHECDHLDGIVYVNRQSKGNKSWTLKKYWKEQKKFERELKRRQKNV